MEAPLFYGDFSEESNKSKCVLSLHVLEFLRAYNSPIVELQRTQALLVHVGWKLYYRNIFSIDLRPPYRRFDFLVYKYQLVRAFLLFIRFSNQTFRYTNILLLGCFAI